MQTPFLLAVAFAALGMSAGAAAEAAGQLEVLQRAEALTKEKKWPQAAAAWQQVVDVNPQLGRAWRELGTARYQAEEYRRAIAAFGRALELRSGYPFNAAYNIACCHALLGEKEHALDWLQKALDLGFRSLRHVREDEDLRSLRDDERFRKMAAVVDVGKLSRDEGWRFDLDLLVREVKRTHYAPFRKVSREEFDAQARRLREDIPRLTDHQIEVGFRKLLCRVGDGHTGLSTPYGSEGPKNRVGVRFYLFAEGLFITEADPRHADLAGAQVLRVGAHSVEEVMRALDQIVPQDNGMGLRCHGPDALRLPHLLNGLGLIPQDKSLPLTVRDKHGKERDVTLAADAADAEPSWVSARKEAPAPEPLYLKKRRTAYWFEYLPEEKLVYCQYNQVWDGGEKESLEKFFGRLFRFIEGNDVGRLVLDLRWNGGGNNFLNEPLIHGLIRCDKINQPGKLFVIVGRVTFSAAMCAAAQIERETKAIFVGEPTGSSPNFVGESAVQLELPYSKLHGSISDLYWQNSVAMDYRTWIAPEVHAPPTFAAFGANRDPALEAILAYRQGREAKDASAAGPASGQGR
jgi:tetratricopeptide (TPR) repeat protein